MNFQIILKTCQGQNKDQGKKRTLLFQQTL